MFAEKHYPEAVPPEDLDKYLAHGWYRMGQTMFTTHFLWFKGFFYSAIWVRLALKGFVFNKRQRKLLRRNETLFTYKFSKATITPEQERLYERYRQSFPGLLANTLQESLLDGGSDNIYDTWQACVYDGNKLVAFSYFDLGSDSAAGIMGIYDHDYQAHSLGFYTMILEVLFCAQQGFTYYYPGYVVPGYARFDYKLRIGDVDYFDLRAQRWLPFKTMPESDLPLNKIRQKLSDLGLVLTIWGIDSQLLYYPLFEANLFAFWRAAYVDSPIILHCFPELGSTTYWLVVFDVAADEYLLLRCSRFDEVGFHFNDSYLSNFNAEHFFLNLAVIDNVAKRSASSGGILGELQQMKQWREGQRGG